MDKVTIIGIDLAKNAFQIHGAAADGSVLFRKKLSRKQFHKFLAECLWLGILASAFCHKSSN